MFRFSFLTSIGLQRCTRFCFTDPLCPHPQNKCNLFVDERTNLAVNRLFDRHAKPPPERAGPGQSVEGEPRVQPESYLRASVTIRGAFRSGQLVANGTIYVR